MQFLTYVFYGSPKQSFAFNYEKCQNKKFQTVQEHSNDIFSLIIQHSIRMCLKVIYNLLGSLALKLTLIIFNTRQDISSQHYLQLLQGRITTTEHKDIAVKCIRNSRIQVIQIKCQNKKTLFTYLHYFYFIFVLCLQQ